MTRALARRSERPARPAVLWTYFTVVMALWCYTPFLRRLVDWRVGSYNTVQVLSVLPLAALIPFFVVVMRRERLARIPAAFKLFAAVWLAAMAYGLLIGAATSSVGAALFECAQYSLPVFAGAWLVSEPGDRDVVASRAATIAIVLGIPFAGYAIYQWISPPPWDVFWVLSADLASVGQPYPMALRVFSTLNAPGPCADFLMVVILLCVARTSIRSLWWTGLAVALSGAAILMTLVRSSWVAVVVGIAAFLLASPRRLRALPFVAAFGLLVVALIPALPQLLGSQYTGSAIAERLGTFGDVEHDDSALTRKSEIADTVNVAMDNPQGLGLGAVGVASKLAAESGGLVIAIDSGYAARFLELGYAGFIAYCFVTFGSLAYLVWATFSPTTQPRGIGIALGVSICAALVWMDAAVDSHASLDGVMFWIALGAGCREAASTAKVRARRAFGREGARGVA